jgi:ATP-binding cassette subfamily C protein
VLTRKATKAAVSAASLRNGIGDGARRNAEVVQAMGMTGRLELMWSKANAQYLAHQQQASDVSGGFGAFS